MLEAKLHPLVEDDIPACAELCERVHGVARSEELRRAIPGFRPRVAVREGRITAYITSVAFWFAAHGVGETDDDLCALLLGAAQEEAEPIEFLLPARRTALFRWALESGLRIVKPMTLMTRGPYQEPRGGFFPSVGY